MFTLPEIPTPTAWELPEIPGLELPEIPTDWALTAPELPDLPEIFPTLDWPTLPEPKAKTRTKYRSIDDQ